MKRLLPLLLLFIFSVTAATARGGKKEAADALPVITLAEKSFDFGQISEDGGSVTHEFVFTNTGTAPLVIVSATASCGCTKPEFPAKPVKPGEKGKIKVTYNPKGRPGKFSKTITVRTNDARNSRIKLRITGDVKD